MSGVRVRETDSRPRRRPFAEPVFGPRAEASAGRFARVHLQWFAAEDEGRTEEPTEHKLRKAREEGKVARSVEFTSALVLLVGIATLALVSAYLMRHSVSMLRYFLSNATRIDIATDKSVTGTFYIYFLRLSAPILAMALAAALAGNLAQVGFLFTVKPIVPDLNRVLPHVGRFLRRALFSGEAAFNLGKSFIKIAAIGLVAYLNIRAEMPRLLHLVALPSLMGFSLVARIAFRITMETALAMLLLAIPDYWYQRRQHLESLKMSRQEIKEERKMYEGDPLVRSRLRERMRELLRRNMLKAVPQADVVITNPTHYAVAVEWDNRRMDAPTVTAKGADHIARRIREVAEENRVPLVENKPLAQALYREVEIGDPIPPQYYEAMATILSEVYRLSGRRVEAAGVNHG
jgi:flagellar biosynthetic protein FlhB